MDKIRRTRIKPKKKGRLVLKIFAMVLLCVAMLILGVVGAELIGSLW